MASPRTRELRPGAKPTHIDTTISMGFWGIFYKTETMLWVETLGDKIIGPDWVSGELKYIQPNAVYRLYSDLEHVSKTS